MDLAEKYFFEYGLPMIRELSEELALSCAAGLAGPGSECLGFDDEISRDHDWGPGFCLWLNDEDFEQWGDILLRRYSELPAEYEGYGPRVGSAGEEHRIGVIRAASFFERYTGISGIPSTLKEWMLPPENLGLCTNGRIFHDPSGFFRSHRRALEEKYPESLRAKRIAARCLDAGQAGQYNLARSRRRGEHYAAFHDTARFCDAVLKLVFLLNRRYPPYYKWLHRASATLPVLGFGVSEAVARLLGNEEAPGAFQIVEDLCSLICRELREQKLTSSDDNFLVDQALLINGSLDDEQLRNYPFQYF